MIEIKTNFIKNNYSSEYKLYNFIFDNKDIFVPILIRSHYFSILGIKFLKQAILNQIKSNYQITNYDYWELTNIILSDRYNFNYFKIKSVTIDLVNFNKSYLNNIVYKFDLYSRFFSNFSNANYREQDLINYREQNLSPFIKVNNFNLGCTSIYSAEFIFSGYIKDVINPNLISSLGYLIND